MQKNKTLNKLYILLCVFIAIPLTDYAGGVPNEVKKKEPYFSKEEKNNKKGRKRSSIILSNHQINMIK